MPGVFLGAFVCLSGVPCGLSVFCLLLLVSLGRAPGGLLGALGGLVGALGALLGPPWSTVTRYLPTSTPPATSTLTNQILHHRNIMYTENTTCTPNSTTSHIHTSLITITRHHTYTPG